MGATRSPRSREPGPAGRRGLTGGSAFRPGARSWLGGCARRAAGTDGAGDPTLESRLPWRGPRRSHTDRGGGKQRRWGVHVRGEGGRRSAPRSPAPTARQPQREQVLPPLPPAQTPALLGDTPAPCPGSSSAASSFPPRPGFPLHPRGRACCLPGGQVRPHPSSNGVSPSAPRPPASPPASGRGRGGTALTELGHVPGHRVVLLAPVQRGGCRAPVALTVRGRSHHARRRRRRRPGAPMTAPDSPDSQACSRPARALSEPRPPSLGAGPGAVTHTVQQGGPAPWRREAAPPRPARQRQNPCPRAPGSSRASFPGEGRDRERQEAVTRAACPASTRPWLWARGSSSPAGGFLSGCV